MIFGCSRWRLSPRPDNIYEQPFIKVLQAEGQIPTWKGVWIIPTPWCKAELIVARGLTKNYQEEGVSDMEGGGGSLSFVMSKRGVTQFYFALKGGSLNF